MSRTTRLSTCRHSPTRFGSLPRTEICSKTRCERLQTVRCKSSVRLTHVRRDVLLFERKRLTKFCVFVDCFWHHKRHRWRLLALLRRSPCIATKIKQRQSGIFSKSSIGILCAHLYERVSHALRTRAIVQAPHVAAVRPHLLYTPAAQTLVGAANI